MWPRLSTQELGALDSAFVYAETPTTHSHVCALLTFDVSETDQVCDFERVRSLLLARLSGVPAMRRKLATVRSISGARSGSTIRSSTSTDTSIR